MKSRLSLTALCFSITCCGVVPAQTASYSLFGNGCTSSGDNGCLNANGLASVPVVSAEQKLRYAIGAKTGRFGGGWVYGFQLLTGSLGGKPITVKVSLYRPNNFLTPARTPVVTGSMTIGTQVGWYAGTFNIPSSVSNFAIFYLAFEGTDKMRAPIVSSAGATQGTHWTQALSGGAWTGPVSNRAWAWRLLCSPYGPSVPSISNVGTPRLNKTIGFTVSKAPMRATAMLLFGQNNRAWQGGVLPLDLGPLGAPGCALLVSPDVILFGFTDRIGFASVTLQVPGSSSLLGVRFFNQWVIHDRSANNLGLVLSAGGAGVIGK